MVQEFYCCNGALCVCVRVCVLHACVQLVTTTLLPQFKIYPPALCTKEFKIKCVNFWIYMNACVHMQHWINISLVLQVPVPVIQVHQVLSDNHTGLG